MNRFVAGHWTDRQTTKEPMGLSATGLLFRLAGYGETTRRRPVFPSHKTRMAPLHESSLIAHHPQQGRYLFVLSHPQSR